MTPWSRSIYLAVLMGAVLADAAVLYFPVNPAQRVVVGLLLVPVMLWTGIQLEAMAMVTSRDRWASRGRVFRELRSQVVLLLEQVRRLNWIAVDAQRGFRDQDGAMREMDIIEDEIREIITDVRRAAGRANAEPETPLIREPEDCRVASSSSSRRAVAAHLQLP